MTRFEKDMKEVKEGNETEILKTRQKELINLKNELKKANNSFKAECLIQDINRLEKEYTKLEENI